MSRKPAAALLFAATLVGCVSQPTPAPSLLAGASSAASPSSATSPAPTASTGPSPTTARPTAAPTTRASATAAFWQATARTVTPHGLPTAVLLPDGRVLAVGGLINDRIDGQILASAERSDPNGTSWKSTRPMLKPRWGHTATLLADGTVLVAGSNRNSAESLASAEVYDPGTGTWAATANMAQGRGDHSATRLADGTVLVTGGFTLSVEDGLASAELFDPVRRSWTTVAPMGRKRTVHTATLLPDGRVLVVGGGNEIRLDEGPPMSASAELYDPTTRTWSPTASMARARLGHSATLLPDGTVLVVGGAIGDDATARSAELYDPASGTWTVTADLAGPRTSHTATLLSDGSVLVAGGVGLGSDPVQLASAELYDPLSRTWSATATMVKGRFQHVAIRLLNGTVLVFGDYDDASKGFAELYFPAGTG